MVLEALLYHEALGGDVIVQLLNQVGLFATPWTAAHQASLSITISQNLLKFTSIESVMPSNHLILCCSLNLSQHQCLFHLFEWGGQNIGASASASVLPVNIQSWFSLGLTGLISIRWVSGYYSEGFFWVWHSTHHFSNLLPKCSHWRGQDLLNRSQWDAGVFHMSAFLVLGKKTGKRNGVVQSGEGKTWEPNWHL